MELLVIHGGQPLSGQLAVSGSKNASLPILAATLAIPAPVCLQGVPALTDVQTLCDLLQPLGKRITRNAAGDCLVESTDSANFTADPLLVRRMRAGVCVLGPLLALRGKAVVPLPGGCQLGPRPIDLHLQGLAALGASLCIEQGFIFAEANELRGCRLSLLGPHGTTVTGTCNVLTAAALATGTTVIEHAAREPEVVDLANFLNACGARISGHGTPEITIEGVPSLQGTTYHIIPDRIEAATLLCATAMTGGEITLTEVCPDHLEAVLQILRATGCRIAHTADSIRLIAPSRLQPVDIVAQPYPGFPTDLQPQLTALLSLAAGNSRVVDEVFPERFAHVPELCRLGARITAPASGSGLQIAGTTHLTAAPVSATDLRGGAALVLAALAARGTTYLQGVEHLDRGYQQFEPRLRLLRAQLFRQLSQLPAASDLTRRTA